MSTAVHEQLELLYFEVKSIKHRITITTDITCSINCKFFMDIDKKIYPGADLQQTERAECVLFDERLAKNIDHNGNKCFIRCNRCIEFVDKVNSVIGNISGV